MRECAVCLAPFVIPKFRPKCQTCSRRCSKKLEYLRHRKEYIHRSNIWRKNNPERWLVFSKRSRAKNPELYKLISRVKEQRRRAIFNKAEGNISGTEWLDRMIAQRGRCWWCAKVKPLHMDHVVPISKGGRHSIDNIVGACQFCNSRKRDNLWDTRIGEFYLSYGGINAC